MAKPAKRRLDEGADGGASGGRGPIESKRVTPPPKARRTDGHGRYTAPTHQQKHAPSPRWVPVTMFGLWGGGLLVIILNYMELLPGSADGGNGWYLVAGLVAILAGIMVATQYR
jgi:hypothetical protein